MLNPDAVADEAIRLGQAQLRMTVQLPRLEVAQVSLWRAALDAQVSLRDMLAHAVAHDIRPRSCAIAAEWTGSSIVATVEPLLALAAVERLDLLLQLANGVIHISDDVWQEAVLRGVAADQITAKLLHTLVHAGKLKHHPSKITPADPRLAPAEEATLALAVQLNADIILTDDPVLQGAAHELGLVAQGSFAILQQSVRHCLIPHAQARTLALRMATRATWLDPHLVEAMLNE